jgi:hypothetical protein
MELIKILKNGFSHKKINTYHKLYFGAGVAQAV